MPVAPNQRLCLLVLVGSVTCVTQRLPCPLPSLQGSPHCLVQVFPAGCHNWKYFGL